MPCLNKRLHSKVDSDVNRKFTLGRLKPIPFPSLPSLPSSPLLTSPPLRSRAPNSVRGSGERCKLPSGVWGGAPAEIEFGAF